MAEAEAEIESTMTETEAKPELSEDMRVEEWRVSQLRKAGIPRIYAIKLARSSSDLHSMLNAHAAGCSLSFLLKIFS